MATIVVGSRDFDRLDAHTTAALELAATIGGELAASVQLDRSRAQSARLAALLEAGHAMASTLDYDESSAWSPTRSARWSAPTRARSGSTGRATAHVPCAACASGTRARAVASNSEAAVPLRDDFPGEYRAIESRQTVEFVISDDGLDEAIRSNMSGCGEKAWLTVPLVYNGQIYSASSTSSNAENERHYRADERELVEGLALRAAAAMSDAKLYRSLQEHSQRLTALERAGRQITASIVLEGVLSAVAENAATALGCRSAPSGSTTAIETS